jgi:hypothetical protein
VNQWKGLFASLDQHFLFRFHFNAIMDAEFCQFLDSHVNHGLHRLEEPLKEDRTIKLAVGVLFSVIMTPHDFSSETKQSLEFFEANFIRNYAVG